MNHRSHAYSIAFCTLFKVELSEKEDALIYYEKTLGENITIQKRATVIYYASKGIKTIAAAAKRFSENIAALLG